MSINPNANPKKYKMIPCSTFLVAKIIPKNAPTDIKIVSISNRNKYIPQSGLLNDEPSLIVELLKSHTDDKISLK